MAIPNPVVVVPGITASRLRDEYPVSPETVWSALLNKDYERLMLHPDDLRYELDEPARVTPEGVYELVYGHLIEELRANLTEKRDKPVPVYPFAYDWRQPLELIERQLERFVQEVIDRTRLMRHYCSAGYDEDAKVNLVGHSMGGLIIAGYLERVGMKAPVARVATLGTPFRGSLEAPIKVITGTSSLDGDPAPASRDREAARLTPSLYHLLPGFAGALQTDGGLPDDLYSVDAWQDGVIETLTEFIRLKGLKSGTAKQRKEQARDLLGGMLQTAKAHRDRIEGFTLSRAGLDESAWLCLIGVDAKTRVRLRIERKGGRPLFNLTGADRCNGWNDLEADKRTLTGDGTVPYLGAEPSFVSRKALVCLRPDDFGYWEVSDQSMYRAAGFHGTLPRLNLAHRLLVSHFRGKATKGAWGRPAPGVSKEEWTPPIKGLPFKE